MFEFQEIIHYDDNERAVKYDGLWFVQIRVDNRHKWNFATDGYTLFRDAITSWYNTQIELAREAFK